MKLKEIELTNFRNYTKRKFQLTNKTVVIGGNGIGKTNLVEAIYMLATGKSFRADTDYELVKYESEFFTVMGQIGEIGEIGVIWTEGKKKFLVNGVPRRMMDFTGKLKAVMFGPADLELVTGSPSVRRRYLDFVISQKDREYRRCLVSYEKGLRQRNKLLDLIRDGVATRQQLFFWDKLLIKNGEYITDKRGDFLGRFNRTDKTHEAYRTNYDKSVISEARLAQYEAEEVAAGSTLVGPHRDDFVVLFSDKDVSKYGSRGEQRMAVLALKIWERDYLSDQELPVLLLDDIYSELDHRHRKIVLKLIDDQVKRGGQVIMTTADEHLTPKGGEWNIITL